MSTLLELVQQHYDHMAKGDMEAAVAAFDPDVETVTPNGTLKGVDEFRALGETFLTAMEGIRHDIVRSFEAGDTIVLEGIYSGRHTGPMVTAEGTIPPSGNQVSFAYADFLQARDGRFVSHRIYWDNLALMAQLGVTP
jgi:predicted ester cyclase